MTYQEESEMTDLQIRKQFGGLIETAAVAFSMDTSYAADIAKKARMIQARRTKRTV